MQVYEKVMNVVFVVMPVALTCNNLYRRRSKDFGSVYIIVVSLLCYFAGDLIQSLLTGSGVAFLKSESTVLIGVTVCILVIAGGHKLWDYPVWRIMVMSATTLSSWNSMYKAFNVGLNDCNTLFAALFLSTLRGVARPLSLDFENYVWDRRSPVFHCVIKKSVTSILYYILSQFYPKDAFLLCAIFSLTADYIHIPETFGFITSKNNENTGPSQSMKQPPNSETTKKTESPEKSDSLSKSSSKSKKTESPERSESKSSNSPKKTEKTEKPEPVKYQNLEESEPLSISPNKSTKKKLNESAERSDSLSLSSSNGPVSPKKVTSS
jgi:uncharacterized membrane protein YeiH